MKKLLSLFALAAGFTYVPLTHAQTRTINAPLTVIPAGSTFDASLASHTYPVRFVSSLPSTCTLGELAVLTSVSPYQLQICGILNTWNAIGNGNGNGNGGTSTFAALTGNATDNTSLAAALAAAQANAISTAAANITSSISAIPHASASVTGTLLSTDWVTFNAKQAALGYTAQNAAVANSNNDALNAASNAVAAIPNASASVTGKLLSTDWSTFNAKQAPLGFTPLNPANNLSEVTAATARTNLGILSAALSPASAFDAAGAGTAAVLGHLAQTQTFFTVGTGGVTANTLVQLSGASVVAATTGYGGIAQTTVASGGTVQVTRTNGVQQACVFDGAAVVGDIVVPSTTTPTDCHDSLMTSSQSIAITTQVIGVVLTAGSGTQTVLMHSVGNGYGLLLPTVASQLGFTPQNAAAANANNDALNAAANAFAVHASVSTTGTLLSTDWTTFNGKQAALGFTPQNAATANANNAGTGNCPTNQFEKGDVGASAPSCAQVAYSQISGTPTVISPTNPLGYAPYMVAFGDSITYGTDLASNTSAYPYWIAKAFNAPVVDWGSPGSTAAGIDAIIFGESFPSANTSIVVETIGTNDVTQNPGGFVQNAGAVAQEQQYGNTVMAQYAWEALPAAQKILFNTSSVVSYPTGTWSHSTLFGAYGNDPGKSCVGTNCTATFTGTGSILYLVTGAQNGNAAAATLTCDGTATASVATNASNTSGGATPLFAPLSGGTYTSPTYGTSLIRVPLSAGAHSCTIQSTSATGTVYLTWAAFLGGSGSPVTTGPYVLAGTVFDRYPYDTVLTSYFVAQQTADVAILRGDGLTSVNTAVTTGTLNTSANTNNLSFADGSIHPNETGHYNLGAVFTSSLATLLGGAPVTYPAFNRAAYNSFNTGSANLGIGFTGSSVTLTTGTGNTGVGWGYLVALTTGNNNSAFGFNSLNLLTTGTGNSAFGQGSLSHSTTAGGNSAFGSGALGLDTTGQSNTAMGISAGYAVTTASGVVAMGNSAAITVTTGSNDVALGTFALGTTTTGQGDTAVGYEAGYNASPTLTTIANSTFLGDLATSTTNGLTNMTVVGYNAQGTASNQITMGNSSVTQNVFTAGVLLLKQIYSVAGTALPTCGGTVAPSGSLAWVSDASATPTYLGTYAGSGSVTALVACNGTNWQYH